MHTNEKFDESLLTEILLENISGRRKRAQRSEDQALRLRLRTLRLRSTLRARDLCCALRALRCLHVLRDLRYVLREESNEYSTTLAFAVLLRN